MPPERATAILKFIASAQSAWVWATNEVRSHPEFLKNTLVWLHTLQPPSRAPNVAEEILSAHEHQMAAYLCDILAVNLHASREIRDTTVLKKVIPRLGFLTQHAGAVNAYNRSLHMNLGENFARKFDGCQIADFARTGANPAPFGRDYFYDKDMADRVLGHEAAWDGPGLNGRPAGFAQEFARANVNLSLVDAQRCLLKSWRVLASMLCEDITSQPEMQDHLAKAAKRCLRANAQANLDVPGTGEVVNVRADIAFVIISKLVGARVGSVAMKSLLPAAWDLVRSSPVDYDVATAAEDLRYYRTLLQILYLAIQPHAYMTPVQTEYSPSQRETRETSLDYLDPNVAATFVEIVAKVIAPGFRALCGNLHNSMDLAAPADFALLTATLRALLSVRGIEAVHPQIANIIASTSLIRGALSLYSWADQLAELMNQDPVYGEVAAMFLLALSTVRPVAELMAVEGVLVQLSSTNLSNYFRKVGGKGPFDEPRRMFPIWTEAFLPLCLNLLDTVGPGIAGDVAAFLNEFPEQLRRAETALENVAPSMRNPHAGAITLGLVSEAHSLCVIGVILESDTLKGAAEGINSADVPTLEFDYRKVKDDGAGLMRQRTSLASRIVAVGPREEAWKAEDGGAGADNVLMGMIVKEIGQLIDAFGDS
jgi:nuclear pore complex protein Nup188